MIRYEVQTGDQFKAHHDFLVLINMGELDSFFNLKVDWVRLLVSFSQFEYTFPLILALGFEMKIGFFFNFD